MMEMSKNCRGGGLNSHKIFDGIISLENLFSAWNEFKKGKEIKVDVQKFAFNLEDNIFELYNQLAGNKYQHSNYTSFYLCDPKLRHIHKAEVKDRVLHHAMVKIIEPIFERQFIFDSYSSRKEKGTHKAIKRLKSFAWRLSQNNTKIVWALKCDIKKFFDSVDHEILLDIVKKEIGNGEATDLIENITRSFETEQGKGIPLGNLTSQLFSNIYLNEFDQFIKRKLQIRHYVRYADDFIILSRDKIYLENLILKIDEFLQKKLKLQLHRKKVFIKQWRQGVDFLGYIIYPHHIILRTKTKKRIFKKVDIKRHQLKNSLITEESFNQTLQSYFGILSHCRGRGIKGKINKICADPAMRETLP